MPPVLLSSVLADTPPDVPFFIAFIAVVVLVVGAIFLTVRILAAHESRHQSQPLELASHEEPPTSGLAIIPAVRKRAEPKNEPETEYPLIDRAERVEFLQTLMKSRTMLFYFTGDRDWEAYMGMNVVEFLFRLERFGVIRQAKRNGELRYKLTNKGMFYIARVGLDEKTREAAKKNL